MMTERKRRFVVEYLKDGNATQAARRAGFSHKTAGSIGQRLLKDVDVAAGIAKARAPALEDAQVTLEGHLKKLAEIRDKAIAAKQFAPANSAEVARGKVSGFYVERIAGPDGVGPVAITVTRRLIRPGASDA
jgi:phage terminase small subunit